MHDSRGARLKVGDCVLLVAEITRLNEGGDENYCCVDVQVVTPDQSGKEKVMQPPCLGALSTKMLTKVGACVLAAFAALMFAVPALAQAPRVTPVSLFGLAEQKQIAALQQQLVAQNAAAQASAANAQAQIAAQNAQSQAQAQAQAAQVNAALQAQISQNNANHHALMMWMLQQKSTPAAPAPTAPIIYYMGPQQQIPIAPPQQQIPIAPPQQQIPIAPPQQQIPIAPPQQQIPIAPPQQQIPIAPPQQSIPIGPPQQQPPIAPPPQIPIAPPPQQSIPIAPAPIGPPVGYQQYTVRPPVISGVVTDRYGNVRHVAPAVWTHGK